MTAADTLPGLAGDQDAKDWPAVAELGGPPAVDDGGTASPPAPETPAQPAAPVDDSAAVLGQRRPVHAAKPPAGSGPAAAAPGAPAAHDVCRSRRCRQKIRWAKTESGESIPVDYAPDPGGRLVRVMKARGDWRIRVLPADAPPPGPGEVRWTSHFATCPEATRFRGRDQARPAAAAPSSPPALAAVPAGPPRLLVVDGNSLGHRSFHALAGTGMRTPAGDPMWAVFGFVKLLAGVLERVRPDALLVGFDDRAGSARRDRYADYKAGRGEKDPALYAQLDQLPGLLAELGVATMIPPALEADDVLASAAAAAERAGWRCTVATSDKDALRLVSDATTVLQLGNGLDQAVTVTPAALEAKYGIRPEQYSDFCVLVGDRSDNLPGVLGIGKVKAAQLLTAVGTLDAALDDGTPVAAAVAAIGKGYAGKLAAPGAAETIARNRDLMTPFADLPVDPEACRPRITGGAIAKVLKAWHMPSLIKAVAEALAGPDITGARLAPVAAPASSAPAPLDAGAVVRGQLAPSLEQTSAEQDEAERTCGQCGAVCAARVPLAGDAGESVLLTGEHLFGEVVMVKTRAGWVGERMAGYGGNRDNRRTVHRCPTYTGTCVTPGHDGAPPALLVAALLALPDDRARRAALLAVLTRPPRPANLYPGGYFCPECAANRSRESGNDT